MDMRTRLNFWRLCLPGAFLCGSLSIVAAQQGNPASIRVESKLVQVHAEVYHKQLMHGASAEGLSCRNTNTSAFYKLPPSEPFIPSDCHYDIVIHGLRAKDFHIFEDGVEQQIESVKYERIAWLSVRDNFVSHDEWASTSRGKWSTVDLRSDWSPSPANYYYRLAYVPNQLSGGPCHKIKVTVDRVDAAVFARDQYCYTSVPATDPLQGTSFGALLQDGMNSEKRKGILLSLQAGFFYAGAQQATLQIALSFPWERLKHEWVLGDLHGTIGVLGIVKRKDGSVAARFSDLACCSSERALFGMFGDNPERRSYQESFYRHIEPGFLPSRYETQVDLPAGESYQLRVVLSDGSKFGMAEMPLLIESYDASQLALSSVLLCNRFRDAGAAEKEAAAANLAPAFIPLISHGLQFSPASDMSFKRKEPLIAYFEVYEPLFSREPKPTVQVHMRIVDAKTGELRMDFPPSDAQPYARAGSTMIPIGDKLVVSQLPKGEYRLEVQASDSAGHTTPWRSACFTLK